MVLYLTLFFKLGDLAFVGSDEPRYARVAEEMRQSADYIVPTLHGRPWLEKPPLYYWLAAASYSLFGVSEKSARLPSALAAALSILCLWWVVKKLKDEDTAFLAALIAATSPLFFTFSRAASTDPIFSSLLSIGLLLYLYGFIRGDMWPCLASGAAIGLATLAKGPIAVILAGMAGLPALAFYPSTRRWFQAILSLLVSLVVALPWYWLIIQRSGFEFISVFFLNHNLARFFTGLHHHQQPFYYYVEVLALGMYPWIIVAFLGGKASWLSIKKTPLGTATFACHPGSNPGLILLGSWILLPLLAFSASHSKLPAYVLPLAVPSSLLLSLLLSGIEETTFQKRRRFVFGSLIAASLALAVAAITTVSSRYQAPHIGLVLGGCLVLESCLAYFLARRNLASALLALAGSNVAIVLFLATVALPMMEPYHSTRSLVQHALARLPANEKFYQYRTFHQTIDYYSGGRTVMESIEDLQGLRGVLQTHSPLWTITENVQVPFLQSQMDFQAQLLESRGNWSLVKISKKTATGHTSFALPAWDRLTPRIAAR